jgi:hypothetical protein
MLRLYSEITTNSFKIQITSYVPSIVAFSHGLVQYALLVKLCQIDTLSVRLDIYCIMLVFDLRIKRIICPLEGIRIVVNATMNIEITRDYDWNHKRAARLTSVPLKLEYPNLHVMYIYLFYYVLYDYILDSPGCEYPPSRHFTCSLSARNFLESLKRICRKFVQVITFLAWVCMCHCLWAYSPNAQKSRVSVLRALYSQ